MHEALRVRSSFSRWNTSPVRGGTSLRLPKPPRVATRVKWLGSSRAARWSTRLMMHHTSIPSAEDNHPLHYQRCTSPPPKGMPHSIVYEKKYYHFLEPLGAPRAHVEPWCFVLLAGHALPTSHGTHPRPPPLLLPRRSRSRRSSRSGRRSNSPSTARSRSMTASWMRRRL